MGGPPLNHLGVIQEPTALDRSPFTTVPPPSVDDGRVIGQAAAARVRALEPGITSSPAKHSTSCMLVTVRGYGTDDPDRPPLVRSGRRDETARRCQRLRHDKWGLVLWLSRQAALPFQTRGCPKAIRCPLPPGSAWLPRQRKYSSLSCGCQRVHRQTNGRSSPGKEAGRSGGRLPGKQSAGKTRNAPAGPALPSSPAWRERSSIQGRSRRSGAHGIRRWAAGMRLRPGGGRERGGDHVRKARAARFGGRAAGVVLGLRRPSPPA